MKIYETLKLSNKILTVLYEKTLVTIFFSSNAGLNAASFYYHSIYLISIFFLSFKIFGNLSEYGNSYDLLYGILFYNFLWNFKIILLQLNIFP